MCAFAAMGAGGERRSRPRSSAPGALSSKLSKRCTASWRLAVGEGRAAGRPVGLPDSATMA